MLPGISAEEIKQLIKDQLAMLSISKYRLDDLLVVPPVETNHESEVVQILAAAVEATTGIQPRLEGGGPTCDGWMFITRGIPAICGYGVKCAGVHGADEWVDLKSMQTITEIYAHTISHYLGAS